MMNTFKGPGNGVTLAEVSDQGAQVQIYLSLREGDARWDDQRGGDSLLGRHDCEGEESYPSTGASLPQDCNKAQIIYKLLINRQKYGRSNGGPGLFISFMMKKWNIS